MSRLPLLPFPQTQTMMAKTFGTSSNAQELSLKFASSIPACFDIIQNRRAHPTILFGCSISETSPLHQSQLGLRCTHNSTDIPCIRWGVLSTLSWLLGNLCEVLSEASPLMVQNRSALRSASNLWTRLIFESLQIPKRRKLCGKAFSYNFANQIFSLYYVISACATTRGHFEKIAFQWKRINGSIVII